MLWDLGELTWQQSWDWDSYYNQTGLPSRERRTDSPLVKRHFGLVLCFESALPIMSHRLYHFPSGIGATGAYVGQSVPRFPEAGVAAWTMWDHGVNNAVR